MTRYAKQIRTHEDDPPAIAPRDAFAGDCVPCANDAVS